MEEKDWRRLLDRMKEGTVVPVIGSRLLVGPDGVSPLFAQVARQLLVDHGIDANGIQLPAFRELNEAVTLLRGKLDDDEDFDDLYGKISAALARFKADSVWVPQPLQQLAEITDFKLMVTLTPDDLLARALAARRGAVNTVVHSPKLSTREFVDLAPDWDADADGIADGDAVQLLYLFGRANKPSPLFAIHDEDVLEYAHNVISHGSNVPSTFLDALRERHLLLIGCNFPDWLSRFFLRATRSGPLAEAKGGKAWLVDRLNQEDPFIGFLGTYSPKTSVLSNIDPVQFVDELHRRWQAEQPAAATAAQAPAQAAAAATNQPDRAVFFISYSRTTDLDHALKLKQTLTGTLKVDESEIWFDKDELEPGDVYTRRILDGIRSCRYFLPIVSRAATERERAFVFREWDEATSLLPEMNRKFLLPLVVDDENKPELYDQPSVNTWRERNINFGHAPDGLPDPVTLKSLQDLLRKARTNPGSV